MVQQDSWHVAMLHAVQTMTMHLTHDARASMQAKQLYHRICWLVRSARGVFLTAGSFVGSAACF
jgi:hypothetical protein